MDNGKLEALEAQWDTYNTILKCNLTDDSYEVIKDSGENNESSSITEWISFYAQSGEIHRDDIAELRTYSSLDKLIRFFDNNEHRICLRYRRVVGQSFVWTSMELIRADEYTADKRIVFLYIRNVQDNLVAELETYFELKHFCNYDTLTNVQNSYAYVKANKLYETMEIKLPVGVVFGDVNGLKIVNDTKGHDMGNSLIKAFCDVLKRYFGTSNVYRLSGDEFVVLLLNVDKDDMADSFEALHEELHSTGQPIGAIGWDWQESPATIKEVAVIAEKHMYEDKAKFYEINPDMHRDNFEKNKFIEQQAVISFLSDAYKTVGIVDLETDEYTMLKTDKRITAATAGATYSEYVNIFCNNLVHPGYLDLLEPVCGRENLKKVLRDTETISARFMLQDGSNRRIVFRKLASDEYGVPTRVIFYASDINDVNDQLEAT